MNHEINRLIQFALDKEMITKDECDYSVNLLLDLFDENDFEYEEINEHLPLATPILEKMLDHAVTKGLIEDNTTSRDLFDTKIMNCIMPRPHTVNEKFKQKYMVSPKVATDYYYKLSIASNYIRKSRTDKNIIWKKYVKYGNIEISINLSKPEKDPKEIATGVAALTMENREASLTFVNEKARYDRYSHNDCIKNTIPLLFS